MKIEMEVAGIKMKNPLVLASGILGASKGLLLRVSENGAGAVTTKSISREEREGHKNPTVVAFDAGLDERKRRTMLDPNSPPTYL